MRLQFLSNTHRILGIIVTVFVVVLCLTGILLLHTDDLQLQDRFADNELLLKWYGIAPERAPRSYRIGESWITQLDAKVYLNGQQLPDNGEVMQGAVMLDDFIIAAFEKSIYLLTAQGDLVERQDGLQGVPEGIIAIAAEPPQKVILNTEQGLYESDLDLISWRPRQHADVVWSKPAEPPADFMDQLLRHYRGEGLPLERVILDLHSGRILGGYGIWLVDIVVIVILLVTVSGWWSWLKRRAMQKELNLEQ